MPLPSTESLAGHLGVESGSRVLELHPEALSASSKQDVEGEPRVVEDVLLEPYRVRAFQKLDLPGERELEVGLAVEDGTAPRQLRHGGLDQRLERRRRPGHAPSTTIQHTTPRIVGSVTQMDGRAQLAQILPWTILPSLA